jgi:chromosome segregation ATPase
MTDTTGIQVAQPVQENEEMSKIRAVFDGALNSIMEATRLNAEVKELAAAVQNLRVEIEDVRRRNMWLDEQLTGLRQSRDQALSDLGKTKDELDIASKALQLANSNNDHATYTINQLRDELTRVRKERDDAVMEGLEANEKLDKANEMLSDIKERTKMLFGLVEQAKDTDKQPPIQATVEPFYPKPEPVQEAGSANDPYVPQSYGNQNRW